MRFGTLSNGLQLQATLGHDEGSGLIPAAFVVAL